MTGEIDDYSAFLIAEARSGNAAFHEFRLLYSEDDGEIHAFFEGEDDPLYYAPHIRSRIGERSLHVYVCEGKWKVRDVRSFIEEDGYSKSGCIFFVDRDYDDLFEEQMEEDDRTFITSPYSVEHYIISHRAVSIIVEDFAGFCAADPERELIFARWSAGQSSFEKQMRPLTAWALSQREAGHKPNFNNVLLKNVLTLEGGSFRRKRNGYAAFKRACCGSPECWKPGNVRVWIKAIDGLDRTSWVRGKFQLWAFTITLVAALEEAVANAKARGKKGVRVPASLRQKRPFDMLGGRLAPPPELEEFLANVLPGD